MSTLRRNRFATVLFALCALLFMQLAVAGYPCAGPESRAGDVAVMAHAGMPCAQEMSIASDEAQPALCHAHCQSEQAAGDAPPLLVPVAVLDHRMFFVALEAAVAPERAVPQAQLLARGTAPPLTIRHCCWRI
ncbi:MAG: hypothetical protein NVS3B2_15960 [Ramlibacter sp.]